MERASKPAGPVRARKRERGEIHIKGPPVNDLLLGFFLITCGIASLLLTAKDLLHWSIAPLLFLGLCALGCFFVGRAVSKYDVIRRARDPQGERRRLRNPTFEMMFLAQAQGWILLLAGYFAWILIGLPLWGPLTPTKSVVALVLFIGLGISFDVGNPYRRIRKRRENYVPGRHAARARRQWPTRRRWVAVVTGNLLIAVGSWQWLGLGGNVAKYLFRAHLTWIIACAFGAGLIGVAVTSALRWRRRMGPRRLSSPEADHDSGPHSSRPHSTGR